MKIFFVSFFLISIISVRSVSGQSHEIEIEKWQQEMNALFLADDESPLDKKAKKKFKGLPFYPIDSSYLVKAIFLRTPNELPFNMPTTTDRLPVYVKYGEAIFELNNKQMVLPLYKSQVLLDSQDLNEYLFLPFTDLTNGETTYGGGRYLDLKVPEGDHIVLDFNKAYNPNCAYNENYSCPIPPKANNLNTRIEAGVKYKYHE